MSELPSRTVPAAELMPVVQAALERGQHVRMAVTGSSMMPFLRHHDTVELVPLTDLPRLGDVVLVRKPSGPYVLHRVVRVVGNSYHLRGDALACEEGPLTLANALGRVVVAERHGRRWSLDRGATRALNWLWRAVHPWSGRAQAWAWRGKRWLCGLTGPTVPDPRDVLRALLLCLRFDTPRPEQVDTAMWPAVVRLAKRHSVMPLLYDRLRSSGWVDRLPAKQAGELRGAYLRNLSRNTGLMGELREILNAMTAAGVPVIVLKGAQLAEAIYGNLALRHLSDLDLLIPRSRLARAGHVLDELGYDLSSWRAGVSEYSHHLPSVRREAAGINIEMHWTTSALGRPTDFQPEELWASSQPVTVAGGAARGLCTEELLLLLAWHMAYPHCFSGDLRAVVDIAAVLAQPGCQVDWDTLVASAVRRGWRAGVGMVLRASHDWLGAPVPEAVLDALQPTADSRELLESMADLLLGSIPGTTALLLTNPRRWAKEKERHWFNNPVLPQGRRFDGSIRSYLGLGVMARLHYGYVLRRWLTGDVTVARAIRAQRRRDAWLGAGE